MTEESDESPLRPAEDQRIRALLADLGSGPDGESMPPEVAARLDATLARLVAEREAADPEESGSTTRDATVVPLRRRWATRGAAAAAAVIVVAGGGIAAANLGLLGGATTADSSAGGSSSASGAERSLGSGAEDQATPSPGQSSPGQPSPGQASDGADRLDNGDAVAKGAVPALTAASFRGQVTTLLGDGDAADLSAPSARGRREVTLPLAPSASPSASAPDAGSDTGGDPGGSPGTATAAALAGRQLRLTAPHRRGPGHRDHLRQRPGRPRRAPRRTGTAPGGGLVVRRLPAPGADPGGDGGRRPVRLGA